MSSQPNCHFRTAPKGALLINKHAGVSSFGIIESLQRALLQRGLRKNELPKLGHGGTLDPFATGLLIVLIGGGVKLARYFLGEPKSYEGVLRFGETTPSGDYTHAVSQTSSVIPESLAQIQEKAVDFTSQPYRQTPPMYSAKKHHGKPLYQLARAGIEVERKPKVCQLYEFNIQQYQPPRASFQVKCSSGTYVRTLAQDFAASLNSLALLDSLHRVSSGIFYVTQAWSVEKIIETSEHWDQLPCWIPFDRLLDGYSRANITEEEYRSLVQGKQEVLHHILPRSQPSQSPSIDKPDYITLCHQDSLVGVIHRDANVWRIERVFT